MQLLVWTAAHAGGEEEPVSQCYKIIAGETRFRLAKSRRIGAKTGIFCAMETTEKYGATC
jgi:hypothetical protein